MRNETASDTLCDGQCNRKDLRAIRLSDGSMTGD